MVQDQHQVQAGEVAAEVADAALIMHPQQTQPGIIETRRRQPCRGGRFAERCWPSQGSPSGSLRSCGGHVHG